MELLSVSPQQLTFYAPYNGSQRRTLTLLNPTNMVVLFKIKSNAFMHYRLKPNAGKVEPYATIEIRLCLQCFDFHEDQEYHHYLSIHSFLKPGNSFNGETPMAIFRSLTRDQIYTKCLPIKLENKPLFLTKCGPQAPCLKKIIMERGLQLKPICPNCAVPSKPKKFQKRRRNKNVVLITVSLLAVLLIAYLLRKELAEILNNLYENQMDYLQCIHLDISQESCINNRSSSSCTYCSSEDCAYGSSDGCSPPFNTLDSSLEASIGCSPKCNTPDSSSEGCSQKFNTPDRSSEGCSPEFNSPKRSSEDCSPKCNTPDSSLEDGSPQFNTADSCISPEVSSINS